MTPDYKRVITDCIVAMRAEGSIFQRASKLVRIVAGEISAIPLANLADKLTGVIQFEGLSKKLLPVQINPPTPILTGILERALYPGIRELRTVTRSPLLRPDGVVLDIPGYDPRSGIVYLPDRKDYLPLGEDRSLEAAQMAALRLTALVDEFPFKDARRDMTAWLALTLTLVARYAIRGPIPFFLAEGNIQGAGKDLLLKAACWIAFPTLCFGTLPEETEFAKRIDALAREGKSHYLYSNVKSRIGGTALEAVTTSRTWTARILAETATFTWPWDCVLMASANGAELTPDMVRRTITIRLEFPGDAEELQKRTFRITDLEATLSRARPSLLRDALLILSCFHTAERPANPECKMAGYEGWADFIPSCLTWLGYPNILRAHGKAPAGSNPQDEALTALLLAWYDEFGSAPKTSAEAIEQAASDDLKKAIAGFLKLKEDLSKKHAGRLGSRLGHVKNRVIQRKRFVGETGPKGFSLWRVEVASWDGVEEVSMPSDPKPAPEGVRFEFPCDFALDYGGAHWKMTLVRDDPAEVFATRDGAVGFWDRLDDPHWLESPFLEIKLALVELLGQPGQVRPE